MWQTFLIEPLTQLFLFLYNILGQNMGLAIAALTLILRLVLLPLSIPAIKAAVKQKDLAPKLAKLKEQYGSDKTGYAKAQMGLMKKEGLNPLSGCLPQILQVVVLFALYRVFIDTLGKDNINTGFLYLDLGLPDQYFILPILAAAGQLIASKIMMPAVQRGEAVAKATDDNKDDLAYNMQKQSLYLFPLMTLVVGYKLPSGLVLYWFLSTVFSAAQQVILQKIYGKK